MPERLAAGWRWSRGHSDVSAAAVLTTATVVAATAGHAWWPAAQLLATLCLVILAALVALRRSHPIAMSVTAGGLLAVPQLTPYHLEVDDGLIALCALAAVLLYAFALGTERPWRISLVGLVPLTIGNALTAGTWNPLMVMLTIGPWAAGLALASRRRTVEQLEQRTRELEVERLLFAEQSVRYERARIARELHDIVAHCVSLMVVQANAGEQLTRQDPARAADAFASISETARQADAEIGRLVDLLHSQEPADSTTEPRILAELVRRAQASGLRVSCRFLGGSDDLADQTPDAVYRLIQEAITNAAKHAPGAPIEIIVRGEIDAVDVQVRNGPAATFGATLSALGGGHGLAGMRERIAGFHGSVLAGPTPEGGWVVQARLPYQPEAAFGSIRPGVPIAR